MRVVLIGVACVGKTTVGRMLAQRLGHDFVDFDIAVEVALGDSIERIKNRCVSEYAFRQLAKPVLKDILKAHPKDLVLAMPPGGLFQEYKRIFDKHPDIVTVVLRDKAKNILKRLVFYDEDSELLDCVIPEERLSRYLAEIKDDMRYFHNTYRKAKCKFDIAGRDAEVVTVALADALERYQLCERSVEPPGGVRIVGDWSS